jgi:hypothetical protein
MGHPPVIHLLGPARLGGLLAGLDLWGGSRPAWLSAPVASGLASGRNGKSSRAAFPSFATAQACLS